MVRIITVWRSLTPLDGGYRGPLGHSGPRNEGFPAEAAPVTAWEGWSQFRHPHGSVSQVSLRTDWRLTWSPTLTPAASVRG